MTTNLGQQHIIDWIVLLDAQVIHLPFALLDKDFINRLHSQNFKIHGSDLNSESEIKEAIRLEVDQFSTDILETAIKVRETYRREIE